MKYIYAQIENDTIINIVLADSANDIFANQNGFERIDQLDPMPQMGFVKQDGNFISPTDPNYLYNLVFNRIMGYRKLAPSLLTEIYTQNTLAGLTTAQSDQLFDDFVDVLTRIREGAFPTALYRLSQKTPSGFVTQELLDTWIDKIKAYL